MQIKPDSERLDKLLEIVRKGEIAIPLFQREYVWTSRQVADFFDSILKGYPIGSLILWSPEVDRFKTYDEIEGVKVVAHDNPLYILDGRQRITTLLSVFSEEGNLANRYYVDLSSEPFRVFAWTNPRLPSDFKFLALGKSLDPTLLLGFLDQLRQSKVAPELKSLYETNAKRINKLLSWYEIGYVKVLGGSINDAEQIFSRLNSKMTPVTTDYMVQALCYNPDNDFLFAQSITSIQDELAEYGLSGISRNLLLKCVYSYTSNTFVDGKAEDLLKKDVNLSEITNSVRNDLTLAVRFLSNECGVIDKRLLPYSYQLILTAIFFRYRPTATKEERRLLKKWFFYTLYDSTFTNSSLSDIRGYVQRFIAWCGESKLQSYPFKDTVSVSPIENGFTLGSVRGAAFTLALINRHRKELTHIDYFDLYTIPSKQTRTTGNVVCCFAKEDKSWLSKAFRQPSMLCSIPNNKAYYELTLDELNLYRSDLDEFLLQRSKKLLDIECQFVKSLFSDEKISFLGITSQEAPINMLENPLKKLLKWLLNNTNWYITSKLDIDRLQEVANLIAEKSLNYEYDSIRNYCISIGWPEETADVIYGTLEQAKKAPFKTLERISREELLDVMKLE